MSTRNPFEIMHEPVASLLSRHGIRYRLSPKAGVTWYNLSKCPLCRHEGHQCGVSESTGVDGKLYHGIKCFHVADNGFGTDTPDYEDFLFKIGELSVEGYNAVKGYDQRSRGRNSASAGRAAPTKPIRLLNPDFHSKLKRRLRENPAALEYLTGRGLTLETINYFGLGLSTPYTSKKMSAEQSDALVYPLRRRDGKLYNKYGYYNIPGVTQNPTDRNGWMSGEVRTYYADEASGKKSIFIVPVGEG